MNHKKNKSKKNIYGGAVEMTDICKAMGEIRKVHQKEAAFAYPNLLDQEYRDKIISIFSTVREVNDNPNVYRYMLDLYRKKCSDVKWIKYLQEKDNKIFPLNPEKPVYLKRSGGDGDMYDYFMNDSYVTDCVFNIVDTEEEVKKDEYEKDYMFINVSMENGLSGELLVYKEENIYNQIAVSLGIDPFEELSKNKTVYPRGYDMQLLKKFIVLMGDDVIDTNETFEDVTIEDGARLTVIMRKLPTLADILYDIDMLHPSQEGYLVHEIIQKSSGGELKIDPDNPRKINEDVNWGDLTIFLLPDSIGYLEVNGKLTLPATQKLAGKDIRFLPLPESTNNLENVEYKDFYFEF